MRLRSGSGEVPCLNLALLCTSKCQWYREMHGLPLLQTLICNNVRECMSVLQEDEQAAVAADSPQWRKGPRCKPVLCNACGTRFLRTRSLGKVSHPCFIHHLPLLDIRQR